MLCAGTVSGFSQHQIEKKLIKINFSTDDDENISKESNVITSSFQHLSTKWSENALRRKLFTQQSDADSAIGSVCIYR